MKHLLLLLLLAPISLFAQLRDSVYVKTDIYECVYSEVLEQPKWIKYTVLCPDGAASRKGMDFYKEDLIKTSDNADYANNIYDKGHMAPAADFNCSTEMLYKTFSYVNCALQNQDLNRVAWRLLEVKERELAKEGTVSVHIKVDFSKETLPTGATVPSGFYKEINVNGKKTCYYFKNEKPASNDFNKALCDCK
jgi:endonuclease G, mitochondrial